MKKKSKQKTKIKNIFKNKDYKSIFVILIIGFMVILFLTQYTFWGSFEQLILLHLKGVDNLVLDNIGNYIIELLIFILIIWLIIRSIPWKEK